MNAKVTLNTSLVNKMKRKIASGLQETGAKFANEVRTAISKPSGDASFPGALPGVRTGKLLGSIRIGQLGDNHVTFAVGGSEAPYATTLEFGDAHGSKHPFVGPTLSKVQASMLFSIKKDMSIN